MEKISLAGCAIIEDRKILLLRRIKTGWYELPGGKIENGETAESTAIREIKEELCSDIKIVCELGKKDFIENGYSMSYTWFQACLINDQRPTIGEPERFDDLKFIELAKLKEYKLSPNMLNFTNELELGNIELNLKF
jgi:8-oxo-dGTP pyrophosphatase MutT (NUDIX family)